jgi:hypothetical protein
VGDGPDVRHGAKEQVPRNAHRRCGPVRLGDDLAAADELVSGLSREETYGDAEGNTDRHPFGFFKQAVERYIAAYYYVGR